jgi:hypothetical protein
MHISTLQGPKGRSKSRLRFVLTVRQFTTYHFGVVKEEMKESKSGDTALAVNMATLQPPAKSKSTISYALTRR